MASNKELSIIIPSRNEMFLAKTIEDILVNIEADTEVIAVLDGAWADPGIKDNERVNLIYLPESIGQRAATNLACKLSRAKYIMKIDAHCSFDKGFDRKMLEAFKESGDETTMVPIMRNLWAFDWKCYKCGWKKYQGPTPVKCENCGDTKHMRRKMMWIGKERPQSTSYCFDSTPRFQYNNEFTKRKGYEKGIIIGYNLSINPGPLASDSLEKGGSSSLNGSQPSSITSIVNLLADLTSSHQFTSNTNSSGKRKNVSVDTMGLSSIKNGRGIRTSEILGVGNELEMKGITTTPVFTEMVNNGDVLSSTPGDRADEPSVSNPMCKGFLSEISAPTISPLIYPPFPIPTTGSIINSDVIQKFNNILGGEFIYNEKTSIFHNGSVALIPIYDKDFTETMSLQGSCFMLTRDRYWELDICDEKLGNWGNQGIEVAVKSWLSGGRVLVNHKTWYAHMFRTQGGDFGFPYSLSGNDVSRTKKNVKDLFFNNQWPKQKYPLSWLVKKFWPVPGWSEESLNKLK